MVKFLLLLLLSVNLVFADAIDKKVKNILGKGNYSSKKGLINVLFKNRADFLTGSRVNMLKVLATLKENNLLDLSLPGTKTIELSFATTLKKPLFFIKTVKDTLNAMGYNHTLTTKAVRDESGFLWKVSIQSAAVIDPLLLAGQLQKRGAYITDIKRYNKENWRYNIDIRRAYIEAKKLPANQKTTLKKPLQPYWIDVYGARSVVISSSRRNLWRPYIVFYDSDLRILDNYTKERTSYNVSLKIPRDAKYMKISDFYTLENVKKGLKIYISQKK